MESIPKLKALGYNKPTKFYNYLFYDDKNLNYYKDKISNVEEEKFVAKRWTSSNGELNLKDIDQNGYGDVLGLNNSILRFFIKKGENDIIKKVILKNSLNWSYKNYKSLVEEINSNQIKYKFRRKRRPNISKQKKIKKDMKKEKRKKLLLKSDIDEDEDDEPVEGEIELDVSKLEKAGESKQITNDNQDEKVEQPEQGQQVEAVVEQPEKSQPDEEQVAQPEQTEQVEEEVEQPEKSQPDEEQVEEATQVDEEDINIEDIPENDNIEGDFDPQEAINIVENDFQLDTFIYLSKKRLKNLTENDFTKAQIFTVPQLNARNLDPNIFKSLKPGIVSNLRYIKLKDHIYDPIKYYLYKPEYWRNNNEAFRYFKSQKRRPNF